METLKNGHLPVKLYSSAPPPPGPLPEDEPKYDKFMVDCSRFITYLRSVYDKQLFGKRFEILVKCSKVFLKIRNRSETY